MVRLCQLNSRQRLFATLPGELQRCPPSSFLLYLRHSLLVEVFNCFSSVFLPRSPLPISSCWHVRASPTFPDVQTPWGMPVTSQSRCRCMQEGFKAPYCRSIQFVESYSGMDDSSIPLLLCTPHLQLKELVYIMYCKRLKRSRSEDRFPSPKVGRHSFHTVQCSHFSADSQRGDPSVLPFSLHSHII